MRFRNGGELIRMQLYVYLLFYSVMGCLGVVSVDEVVSHGATKMVRACGG